MSGETQRPISHNRLYDRTRGADRSMRPAKVRRGSHNPDYSPKSRNRQLQHCAPSAFELSYTPRCSRRILLLDRTTLRLPRPYPHRVLLRFGQHKTTDGRFWDIGLASPSDDMTVCPRAVQSSHKRNHISGLWITADRSILFR